MKRKTAKEILADSFRELAMQKTVDKITVKDITENCGYSTATFYHQFKDKHDLIAWDYTRGHREIMDRVDMAEYEWRQTLIDGANYFYKDKKYLANLLLNTTGYDSFVYNMSETHYNSLEKCVIEASGSEHLDEKTKMCIRLYCLGTTCLTCEWILGKYKATPQELAEVYENSLPAPLREYLY